MSPKKTEFEKEHQIEYYQDYFHRNTKLEKLQSLMRVEIEKVREGVLGNEAEKLEVLKKSVVGYPSFMKESEDKLKHKEMQRKDSGELEQIERALEEQGIEISEDRPYVGSTALKIVQQEFNQVHFQDPAELLQERVEHAEENPVSEGEESLGDEREVQLLRGNTSAERRHYLRTTGKETALTSDIFDTENLYHLNTKKNYIHPSSSDADLYDFHQRKSKEIRRLQYVAGLEKRKRKRSPPPPKPVSEKRITPVPTPPPEQI